MISEIDQARLTKLLGMLGSDFDGERANAALMVANMAKRLKMPIAEMCGQRVQSARTDRARTKPRQTREQPKTKTPCEIMQRLAEAVTDYSQYLSAWENEFALDVSCRGDDFNDLSEKQQSVVTRILAKVDIVKANNARRAGA